MSFFEIFMSHGGWALYSSISTAFLATILIINQYMRQPGHLLVFFSRIITVLLMTPFVLMIPWPNNPIFYVIVFFTAIFGASADIRTFNVSAKYGGGVASRTMPFIIFFSFFIWLFFDVDLLKDYMNHPLNTIGILASLLGVIYFSLRLKKCKISNAAFIAMLPALLGYTVNTILVKFSMHMGDPAGVVFGYMYVQSIAAIFFTGIYAYWRENKMPSLYVSKRKILFASILLSILWIGTMIFKNYAMIFIPNPAYYSSIVQISPILIAIFYYFTKHKETADVKSGIGVVACAILLVLMAI